MTRIGALAAALLAVGLCVSCGSAKPVDIAVPEGVDLEAAAQLGDSGNGLWLLDGPVAASRVIEAMRSVGGVAMTAHVQELTAAEQGDPLPGRVIDVTSRSDGSAVHATLTIGDQQGEFVIIGAEMWVKGNEAFTERLGVRSGSEFVCISKRSASAAELEALAEPAEFLRTALLGLEIGTLPPSEAEPDVLKLVVGAGGAPTGELLVEAHGAPLPRSLDVGDQSGSVHAQFTWGGVSEISAPERGGCEAHR